MSKSKKQKKLKVEEAGDEVKNDGEYVIKIGKLFVADYRSSFLTLKPFEPISVVDSLSAVQEFIYDEDNAKEIAKRINGKVYQIHFELKEVK